MSIDERPFGREPFGEEAPGDRRGVEFAAAAFAETMPERRTSFSLGERVHWRASFGLPVGAVRLEVVTVLVGADGWERAVSGHELWLAHPDATSYAGWLDLPAYRSSGRFVLRFVRGGAVLAEGEFEIHEGRAEAIVH